MDKKEFIWQLNQKLADLPEEERTEAVSYYEEYLEDAGLEQEARTLEELGSPEQVAAIIRENLYGDPRQGGIYTETGYHGRTEESEKLELDQFTQIVPKQAVGSTGDSTEKRQTEDPNIQSDGMDRMEGATIQGNGAGNGKGTNAQRNNAGNVEGAEGWGNRTKQPKKTEAFKKNAGDSQDFDSTSGSTFRQKQREHMSGEKKALFLVLALLCSIPLAAMAIAVIAVIVGAMVTVFGVAISFVALTGACLVTGIVLAVIGIANIVSASPAGILLCGLGFLFFGAGMLFLIATVFVFKTLLPLLAKGFVSLCRLPFQKGENMA